MPGVTPVFDAGNGTVGIVIVLGDLNPAPLPPKHDLTVQWSQLGNKYSYVIDALQITDILTLDIASAYILNRGILTDLYDAPSASSSLDSRNIATPVNVDQLAPGAGLSEDDALVAGMAAKSEEFRASGDRVYLPLAD